MTSTLDTAVRALVARLDRDIDCVFGQRGLAYRASYTPVVRAMMALGPCSAREIALQGWTSYSEATKTLDEMATCGLVKPRPTQGADLYAFTERMLAMLPAVQEIWRAVAAAEAELSGDVGTNLAAVLDQTIEQLRRRAFVDRILSL